MTKVLVIEDEKLVRQVVSRLLTGEGYEVIEAPYGRAGYQMAVSEKPNIILLDLMMPVMDGFEVLSKLKGNPETEPIPVIILTARIDSESERRCMRSGAVDYIKKPWGLANSGIGSQWRLVTRKIHLPSNTLSHFRSEKCPSRTLSVNNRRQVGCPSITRRRVQPHPTVGPP